MLRQSQSKHQKDKSYISASKWIGENARTKKKMESFNFWDQLQNNQQKMIQVKFRIEMST